MFSKSILESMNWKKVKMKRSTMGDYAYDRDVS